MAEKTHYELIILGAGPAGIAAGIYAARKQLDTLVLTSNIGGQTTWSSGIENYLGYVFVTGTDLVRKFEEHLRTFPVDLEFTPATSVSVINCGFRIDTEDGRTFFARSVVIATGKSPRMLEVPGEREFIGKGVTYCATCDAPLFADMEVAVIGGGNSGLDAVMQLMKICPKVYLIEKQSMLRADKILQQRVSEAKNVEIITPAEVTQISGEQMVNQITVKDADSGEIRQIPVQGVFVEVGLSPNSDLVKDLLELNEYGEVPVDCTARTAIPGLYAAGDVTIIPEKQIIIAAGEGAKAALGAYSYVVRLPEPVSDWGHMTADNEPHKTC